MGNKEKKRKIQKANPENQAMNKNSVGYSSVIILHAHTHTHTHTQKA